MRITISSAKLSTESRDRRGFTAACMPALCSARSTRKYARRCSRIFTRSSSSSSSWSSNDPASMDQASSPESGSIPRSVAWWAVGEKPFPPPATEGKFTANNDSSLMPSPSSIAACHACCGDLASYTRTLMKSCSRAVPMEDSSPICQATDRRKSGDRGLCCTSISPSPWIAFSTLAPSPPSYTASISHRQSMTRSSVTSCSWRRHLKPIGNS
mmetsp:Transcript_17543/g.38897  ORF Transcript_17543/g.38897 Transcript_17543/m.38897 type:complete len:213 (+) Transcript_17543:6806-7444(+)